MGNLAFVKESSFPSFESLKCGKASLLHQMLSAEIQMSCLLMFSQQIAGRVKVPSAQPPTRPDCNNPLYFLFNASCTRASMSVLYSLLTFDQSTSQSSNVAAASGETRNLISRITTA